MAGLILPGSSLPGLILPGSSCSDSSYSAETLLGLALPGLTLLSLTLLGLTLLGLTLRRFGPIEPQEAASGWATTGWSAAGAFVTNCCEPVHSALRPGGRRLRPARTGVMKHAGCEKRVATLREGVTVVGIRGSSVSCKRQKRV